VVDWLKQEKKEEENMKKQTIITLFCFILLDFAMHI